MKCVFVGCVVLVNLVGARLASYTPNPQRTRPDLIRVLDVPATAPWTDTGIDLQPGDRVQIRAWGVARFAKNVSAGPRGSSEGGGCTYVVKNPGVAAHSLVGNVAPGITFDGGGFFVGSSWAGTVPMPGASAQAGHLLLGVNDSSMMCDRSGYDSWAFRNNNSGAFTAEVTVTHGQ